MAQYSSTILEKKRKEEYCTALWDRSNNEILRKRPHLTRKKCFVIKTAPVGKTAIVWVKLYQMESTHSIGLFLTYFRKRFKGPLVKHLRLMKKLMHIL